MRHRGPRTIIEGCIPFVQRPGGRRKRGLRHEIVEKNLKPDCEVHPEDDLSTTLNKVDPPDRPMDDAQIDDRPQIPGRQIRNRKVRDLERAIHRLEAQLVEKSKEVARREEAIRELHGEIARIHNTLGWRLLSLYAPVKYRLVLPFLRLFCKAVRQKDSKQFEAKDEMAEYREWASWCEALRYDPERAARRIRHLGRSPLISILMIIDNPPVEMLRVSAASMLAQYYEDWELCVCSSSLTKADLQRLLEDYRGRDGRIRLIRRDGETASPSALESALDLAGGELVGFLDPGDEVTPDALLEIAAAYDLSDADLIYSDEDSRDAEGRRCSPVFKPGWSPDLLMSFNYIGRLAVYRRTLLDSRRGGTGDYDVALRASEQTDRIAHIPVILYHRSGGSAMPPSGDDALSGAIARQCIRADVMRLPEGFRVKRHMVNPGKVSIIIPTRDRLHLLSRCIEAIETKTVYDNYEIIIVDNGSDDPAALQYLSQSPNRVLRHDAPFNFSELNNAAAREATGDYLLLVNNDTEVITGEWLSAMVEQAQRPEVGAVGAKLLYPDGKIQHAGVILGLEGPAGHSHRSVEDRMNWEPIRSPDLIRNCSAVTAACMMIRRELYLELGGMNELDLPVSFNDVDLCLRLREKGYLIVYTPYAVLYHHEFASRAPALAPDELAYVIQRWRAEIACDPYYSPNLSLTSAYLSLDLSKPEGLYGVFAQEQADQTVDAASGAAVGQEFFVPEENLSAVAVRIACYRGRAPAKLRMRLCESFRSVTDIRVVDVPVERARDNEYCTFYFDPIRNSSGRKFYFRLELVGATPGAELLIWRSHVTDSRVGPYLIDHRPGDGTLCFKVYCFKQFRMAGSGPSLLGEVAAIDGRGHQGIDEPSDRRPRDA